MAKKSRFKADVEIETSESVAKSKEDAPLPFEMVTDLVDTGAVELKKSTDPDRDEYLDHITAKASHPYFYEYDPNKAPHEIVPTRPVLGIYKMHPDVPPIEFGTLGSACFDLRYCRAGKGSITYYLPHKPSLASTPLSSDHFVLKPRFRYLIPTGLKLQIPDGYSVRIHPRSGIAYKQGVTLVNCEGVIDQDYVEEIFLTLINLTDYDVTITNGDRLAQAELVKTVRHDVEYLPFAPIRTTDRTGGLGSTGVS